MPSEKKVARAATDPALLKELFSRIGALRSADRILEASTRASVEVGEHGYLHFLTGRAHLDKGDLAPACEHLEISLKLSPGFHWAAYELARALAQTDRVAAAGAQLRSFLAAHEQQLNQTQLKICETIADRLFNEASRADAMPVYQRLGALGATRYLTLLRAFEGWLDSGHAVEAQRLLEKLGDPPDAWGHLALARYHASVDDGASVQVHAVRACELAPEHPMVALAALQQLKRAGAAQALPALFAGWQARLPAVDLALLRLVAARTLGGGGAASDIALALQSPLASKWPFIEHLYSVAETLSDVERESCFGLLQARFPADPDLLMCLANVEVAQRRFESGKSLCEAGLDVSEHEAHRLAFRFKLFEVECFCSRLDQARLLLQALPATALEPAQLTAVARYHAEVGDWPQALAVLAGLLDSAAVAAPDLADLIVRAARRTGGQRPLLEKLASRGGGLSASLQSLSAALFEDWLMVCDQPEACAELADRLAIPGASLLEFKLASREAAVRAALAGRLRRADRPRRAVFFCADKAYVMPAAVSLSSLLEKNALLQDADFHIVMDDPLVADVAPLLDKLGAHYGVRIFCKPTSELVPQAERLTAAYGVFTGGHQLAVAAYYRIYMARALAESGRYEQLLYIDSDTVAAEGFEELFALGATDHRALLMARLEIDRQEVRAAILAHGLPAGRYFNSGVLLFPRVGPELVETLKRVEQVAEERHQDLFFQDQCALNIGFAGAFEPLPERFNFFAGPRDAEKLAGAPAADVCLMHVLDRPKPWDSAYPRDTFIQRRWLHAARTLQRVLGTDGMRRLTDFTFV